MARGNQRDKAREKNLKAQAQQVSCPSLEALALLPDTPRALLTSFLSTLAEKVQRQERH